MSLSPCSSDLGADIISTLGALTCVDIIEDTFFVQGRVASTYYLISCQIDSAGVVTENWRATSVDDSGNDYYFRLYVTENYILAQSNQTGTKFYVLDKTDGSKLAERDFDGIEVGDQKQTGPFNGANNKHSHDIVAVGDYAYFASLWFKDKNNTGSTDDVEWGFHVVNLEDLTDLDASEYLSSTKKAFTSVTFPGKDWNKTETMNTAPNSPGRMATMYKKANGDYVLSIATTGFETGTDLGQNSRRHRIRHHTIQDIANPALYNPVIVSTQIVHPPNALWRPSAFWAPIVSNDTMYYGNLSRLSPLTDAGYYENTGTAIATSQGEFWLFVSAGGDHVWASRSNENNSNEMFDYVFTLGTTVDSDTRTNTHKPISLADSNYRGYIFDVSSGLRYNDKTDLSDSTSLDFSALSVDQILQDYGQSACDRAGGGLHDLEAGVW